MHGASALPPPQDRYMAAAHNAGVSTRLDHTCCVGPLVSYSAN
jgi:hypothetical protein